MLVEFNSVHLQVPTGSYLCFPTTAGYSGFVCLREAFTWGCSCDGVLSLKTLGKAKLVLERCSVAGVSIFLFL